MEATAYKYKPTEALKRISPIIKKNDLAIIRGGAGAGKTISILMLLIDYCWRNSDVEVTICSAELSKLKDTAINDFIKILKDYGIFDRTKWNKSEYVYRFSDSTFIEFIGLDKADVGKGRRRKIIYINEVNKITRDKFYDIELRGEKIVVDFNPDKEFFITEIETPENTLVLNHTHNEFCPPKEAEKIQFYKEKGYHSDGRIKSEYFANKYRVLGLGEYGVAEGRIYYWDKCTDDYYRNLEVEEWFGVDWGTVDPFAITGIKYYDGNLYVHKYNYASENEIRKKLTLIDKASIEGAEEEGLVVWLFKKLNIPQQNECITDSNRPSKVIALRRAGWENLRAIKNKGKIVDRIDLMQNLNVFYTESSKEIGEEQKNSCWKKDRGGNDVEEREDIYNHSIDSIEYVVLEKFREGVIRI